MVESLDPLTKVCPLSVKSIDHKIVLVWPVKVLIKFPNDVFHNLMVVSADPLAKIVDVICLRLKTVAVCPVRVNLKVFVFKSHILTVVSSLELAKVLALS
jgi:hypothetical protein